MGEGPGSRNRSADISQDRRSQTERIRDELRRQILQAELPPGGVVIETGLAQLYGVSKTPVREALQLLAVEGLVTVLPRKGYMVTSLSYQDIREVMDLRLLLEPPLFAAAARNVNADLVVELRDHMARQFAEDADLNARVEAATGFHLACVRASRNGRAVGIVERLTNEVCRLHHLVPGIENHIRSDDERAAHEAVSDAIAAGEASRAETAIRDHLLESNATMIREYFTGTPIGSG
jgi:DNA-binding GntR family transcriptional regulator